MTHATPSSQPRAGVAPQPVSQRGRWSTLVLVRRHLTVFLAEGRVNVLWFFLQPVAIGLLIDLVAVNQHAMAKKLFLGYIVALWLGCSNAAQVLVRERAIFLRETLAGMRVHNYLCSKFICLGFFALLQSCLLFSVLKWRGSHLIGDPYWQFGAIAGSALAMSGLGILISAFSKTATDAVMIVPLVIIPQILFSGYVFELQQWLDRPRTDFQQFKGRLTTAISRICPSYAAQRLIDISLIWNRKLDETYINDYGLQDSNLDNLGMAVVPPSSWLLKNYSVNLSQAEVEHYSLKYGNWPWPHEIPQFQMGRTFTAHDLAYWPIGVLTVWYVGSYAGAYHFLRRRGNMVPDPADE